MVFIVVIALIMTACAPAAPTAAPAAPAAPAAAAPAATTAPAAAAPAATTAPAAAAPTGSVLVGLITKTDTNPFFVKMKEGADTEAKAKGATLMTAAGKFDGDTASQITAIENMVSAGVKGIMITPSDSKALNPAIKKARDAGVMVISLDSPVDPVDATDALFATDNFKAGVFIGQYVKAKMAGKPMKVATIDLFPGPAVGVLRHNGFLSGAGLVTVDATETKQLSSPEVVCMQDGFGDQAKGQTAMENCLTKNPDINVVYTINEPDAYGAYTALKNAGKEKNVIIVSVDGSCQAMKAMKSGMIAATSMQFPLKMAVLGVDATVDYVQNGKKASGYTDTGVNLITDTPVTGLDSVDSTKGADICWGTVK
jgi:fructose transport system substrate-binding protein